MQEIGAYSFSGCSGLTQITIGANVQTIGTSAFENCTSLKSIDIPANVQTINESAFYGCSGLTTLTLNEGLKTIKGRAFYGCPITELIIPNSVTTITTIYWSGSDRGAFEECRKLERVVIGNGLTSISKDTFQNCTALKSVVIGDFVATIGESAFNGCAALTDVTIGKGVQVISNYAFANCTALASIHIPDNVQTIGDRAFEGCTLLVNFNIGTGVQRIGAYALQNCSSLKSVAIPANVQVIGAGLFTNCSSLEEVIIEKGVLREVGNDVFNGCSSFDRIYYTGTASDWVLVAVSEDNSYPLNVSPYYYSENQPATAGNYWYYNGNGAKRVWNVSETSFDAEYSSENFVELFGGEDSSYSTTFFKELDNDSNFKSGLYAWEALHMIADTSFSEGVWKVSKKDLYKLVIFDLLCGEANAQETIFDAFDTSTVAYIDDLAKDIFGQEVTHDFLKSISPKLDYSTKLVKYNVIGLQYIFESHSNMYDALKSCATYLVLADMDESFQTVLLQIANDSSNPWELREAAREYAEIFKMSASQILANYAVEYYTSDVRATFTIFSDLLWDKTVEMVFPEFAVAQSIAKGILFLADLGCNIDGIYMAYYKLDVAVHLEASLRKIIHNTEPDYYRVSNRANSEIYVYAVDMYKTSVLLGFDYSNNLLREDCEKKSDEEKEAYITMMNNISSMKTDKQALYNRFDNLVSQAYVAYYS